MATRASKRLAQPKPAKTPPTQVTTKRNAKGLGAEYAGYYGRLVDPFDVGWCAETTEISAANLGHVAIGRANQFWLDPPPPSAQIPAFERSMLEVDGITPHLFIVLHSEQAADLEFSMDIPNEGDPIHIVPLASFFGQGTYSAWVGSLQPGRRHNVLRMSAEMAQAPIVVQSLKMLSECHKSCFLFSQRGGLRDVAAMARRLRELAHKYFGRSSFNCALTWNPKDGRLRVAVGADSSNGFTFVDEGQPLLGEQMPSYQHSSTDRLLLPIVNFKERLDGCPWDEPTTRAVVKVIHDIVEEILLRQVTGEEGRVLGVVLREHARKYFRLRRRRESEEMFRAGAGHISVGKSPDFWGDMRTTTSFPLIFTLRPGNDGPRVAEVANWIFRVKGDPRLACQWAAIALSEKDMDYNTVTTRCTTFPCDEDSDQDPHHCKACGLTGRCVDFQLKDGNLVCHGCVGKAEGLRCWHRSPLDRALDAYVPTAEQDDVRGSLSFLPRCVCFDVIVTIGQKENEKDVVDAMGSLLEEKGWTLYQDRPGVRYRLRSYEQVMVFVVTGAGEFDASSPPDVVLAGYKVETRGVEQIVDFWTGETMQNTIGVPRSERVSLDNLNLVDPTGSIAHTAAGANVTTRQNNFVHGTHHGSIVGGYAGLRVGKAVVEPQVPDGLMGEHYEVVDRVSGILTEVATEMRKLHYLKRMRLFMPPKETARILKRCSELASPLGEEVNVGFTEGWKAVLEHAPEDDGPEDGESDDEAGVDQDDEEGVDQDDEEGVDQDDEAGVDPDDEAGVDQDDEAGVEQDDEAGVDQDDEESDEQETIWKEVGEGQGQMMVRRMTKTALRAAKKLGARAPGFHLDGNSDAVAINTVDLDALKNCVGPVAQKVRSLGPVWVARFGKIDEHFVQKMMDNYHVALPEEVYKFFLSCVHGTDFSEQLDKGQLGILWRRLLRMLNHCDRRAKSASITMEAWVVHWCFWRVVTSGRCHSTGALISVPRGRNPLQASVGHCYDHENDMAADSQTRVWPGVRRDPELKGVFPEKSNFFVESLVSNMARSNFDRVEMVAGERKNFPFGLKLWDRWVHSFARVGYRTWWTEGLEGRRAGLAQAGEDVENWGGAKREEHLM